MSWHYLRELEGEFLEDICSGGEPFAPLKSKITHAVFYSNGKLMDSYLDSLSGTMSAHSMENLGEEKSMSSAEDFLARTSVLRGGGEDLTAKDQVCGAKWRGSFTKYDPVTSLWKTHQCSLLGDLDVFSETWPQWGLMRDGECWEQKTLVQTTNVNEFGLLESDRWPTPDANMGKRGYQNPEKLNQTTHQLSVNDIAMKRYGIKKLNPQLCEWLMGWPLEWTDLNPLGTDKFHLWQQQHGKS